MTTLTISTDQFTALRELIARRSGILVPDHKSEQLAARLADHLVTLNVPGFGEYLQLLSTEEPGSPIWQEVYCRVSTNETFFFRNEAQMAAFTDVILPSVMAQQERKLFKRLKIWSAACATGEEPYTIAMQVLELLGDDLSTWQPQILATDIDRDVLDIASSGHYSGRSLTNVPQRFLSHYFDANGDDMTVGPELRALIQFKQVNFADPSAMAAQTNMDVIFCRNVLIYFDDDFRKQVVAQLYDSLKPGGYLVIGHAESLRDLHSGFEALRQPGTTIYQRPGDT